MKKLTLLTQVAFLILFQCTPLKAETLLDAHFVEVKFSSYFPTVLSGAATRAYRTVRNGVLVGSAWTEVLPTLYPNCLSTDAETAEAQSQFGCKATKTYTSRDELLSVIYEGTESNQAIIDSEASRACESIGGKLPSLNDFYDLVRSFQTSPSVEGSPAHFESNREKDNFWNRSFPVKETLFNSFATRNCSQNYGASGRAFPCESNIQFDFFLSSSQLNAEMRATPQSVLCVSKLIQKH